MGRPKNKSGSAPWKPSARPLREKARNDIEFPLGLDSRRADESSKLEDAFLESGYWVGIYKDAIEAYKDTPKSADYRNSLLT